MKKGLPTAIIKKYGVTKKAWQVFRGRHKSHKSSVSKTKTRRSVSHTKRKKGGHRRGSLQQSVERLAQGASLIAPGVYRGYEVYRAEHNAGRAFIEGVSIYGGLQDGRFHGERLVQAWTPVVAFTLAKVGVHKLIGLIRRI